MKLLYDENFISVLFKVLIVATPVAAALGFLIHSRLAAGRCSRRARVLWAVLALVGPFNYGLWNLFNAIEDRWGLDRVEPLLINFTIFILLGVAIGLLLRFLLWQPSGQTEARRDPTSTDSNHSAT